MYVYLHQNRCHWWARFRLSKCNMRVCRGFTGCTSHVLRRKNKILLPWSLVPIILPWKVQIKKNTAPSYGSDRPALAAWAKSATPAADWNLSVSWIIISICLVLGLPWCMGSNIYTYLYVFIYLIKTIFLTKGINTIDFSVSIMNDLA